MGLTFAAALRLGKGIQRPGARSPGPGTTMTKAVGLSRPRCTRGRSPLVRGSALAVAALVAFSGTAPSALAGVPANDNSAKRADQAAAEAVAFRRDLQRTLTSYVSTYGDRLTEAERGRVSELISQADRDLAGVTTQAATTTRWAKRGNQAKALASAKSAVRVYDDAVARAEQAIAEIKPILAPRLGFLEAIEAQRDLDAHMNRYRALGTQLRAVVATLKA